ncbi:MAG: helix-turn-helix domain containing protein [Patulibacter minatonensis]
MTTSTSPAAKPLRADARRNRETVVRAARELFAEQGVDAPMDEVARRAGVGAGTLYRHFPDRGALVLAVVQDDWQVVLDAEVRALEGDGDPVDDLDRWLTALAFHQASMRGLVAAIVDCATKGCRDDPLVRHCATTMEAAARLLARAQATGRLRADLTAPEVLDLVNGVVLASDRHSDQLSQVRRLLPIVLAGLRG